MKISVAQIHPVMGDIPSNIQKHIAVLKKAIRYNVDALFFPELSLTGYDLKFSEKWACEWMDPGLDMFQEMCDENFVTLGLGLPTKGKGGINISMVIFQPDQARSVYSKQQLHADEKPFFIEGGHSMVLTVGDSKIVPGICYETLQPDHFRNAVESGAHIYIASVAKSIGGIRRAEDVFPERARKYSIPVLLANSLGFCDNFMSCGKSSVWNKSGELIGQLNTRDEGILVFDTKADRKVQMIKL